MAHALLVEDDVFSSAILQEILMASGHSVRLVYDGASALKLIESDQQFDVAVIDLLLPNQIALDVIRALRKRAPKMAVIGIGGEAGVAVRSGVTPEAASAAGANASVMKPISRPELARLVTSLLS